MLTSRSIYIPPHIDNEVSNGIVCGLPPMEGVGRFGTGILQHVLLLALLTPAHSLGPPTSSAAPSFLPCIKMEAERFGSPPRARIHVLPKVWFPTKESVVDSEWPAYTAASLGDGLLLRGRRGVGWLAFGADYSGYAGMTGTGFSERPFGGSEKDRKVGLTGR